MTHIILTTVAFIIGYIVLFHIEGTICLAQELIGLITNKKPPKSVIKKASKSTKKRVYKPRKPKANNTVKTYRKRNVVLLEEKKTEEVPIVKKDSTFTPETEKQPNIQIPNDKIDKVFNDGIVYEDEPISEELIDCSVGDKGEIDETYGNCLFTDLIKANHIAKGKKVSEEEEIEAYNTISNMYGTNVMKEMMRQTSEYLDFATKIFYEKLDNKSKKSKKKKVKNNDFDVNQFYVASE